MELSFFCTGYSMTLFHRLLIWIYKQGVTDAHFSLCLQLLQPQMLLQHDTGNANISVLWRVMPFVRVKAPVVYRESIWGYSSVTVVYSSHFHASSWSHSLSGNAFSFSNDYIENEMTETCGTHTPSYCWDHCAHVRVSWIEFWVSWKLSFLDVFCLHLKCRLTAAWTSISPAEYQWSHVPAEFVIL